MLLSMASLFSFPTHQSKHRNMSRCPHCNLFVKHRLDSHIRRCLDSLPLLQNPTPLPNVTNTAPIIQDDMDSLAVPSSPPFETPFPSLSEADVESVTILPPPHIPEVNDDLDVVELWEQLQTQYRSQDTYLFTENHPLSHQHPSPTSPPIASPLFSPIHTDILPPGPVTHKQELLPH